MAVTVVCTPLFFECVCDRCGNKLRYDLSDVIQDGDYAPHVVCVCENKVEHTGRKAVYDFSRGGLIGE